MEKKFYRTTISAIILLFTASLVMAEVKLPAIFGDNMVLQQQTETAIWGKATAASTVRITTSWNKKSYTGRAGNDGNWKIRISTPTAGGPYSLTISDGNAITLKNVMIGEVWVCSGQSNMEMPMKGYRNQPVLGSNEYITFSENNNIRLITVPKKVSYVPMDDFEGSWTASDPETVSRFSATAYFFGLMLNKALDVPVGLIHTSWGGTRIEPWISEEGCRNFDFITLSDMAGKSEAPSPQTPTVLYNAMINPIAGYGLRGAIWYQGESNRNQPDQYQKLMPALADNWRLKWAHGDFPMYFVQIAPFDYGPEGLNSAFLREAQLKASAEGKNMGMACLMDCGEKDCIHPANKKAAGERLALQALVKTYGKKGLACDGPVLKEMKIEGSQVVLTFDNAANGLTSFGKGLSCFEIAGNNKRFYPAEAFISSTGITLFSHSVVQPVAVRYAFKDFITGDLFNTEGLPASSFRTDNW